MHSNRYVQERTYVFLNRVQGLACHGCSKDHPLLFLAQDILCRLQLCGHDYGQDNAHSDDLHLESDHGLLFLLNYLSVCLLMGLGLEFLATPHSRVVG